MMGENISDTGEFGLIKRIHDIIDKNASQGRKAYLGIGDDCASFSPKEGYQLLVTCDSVVEGRHYLPRHISAYDLGRRAMAINISDIGAMGGVPVHSLVSLGLKGDMPTAYVEDLYMGFTEELNPLGASIIGGNITKSDNVFIDITLIGEVEEDLILKRSTAKAGDAIIVTGFPGESAAGLKLLLNSESGDDTYNNALVRKYNRPAHRAREGRAVAMSGYANCMIDMSDGFLGDLGHVCEQSRVGAEIIRSKLPLSVELKKASVVLNEDSYEMFLSESDDYELIITCPPENIDKIKKTILSVSDIPVSEVGRITEHKENISLLLPDGVRRDLVSVGWDHFSK